MLATGSDIENADYSHLFCYLNNYVVLIHVITGGLHYRGEMIAMLWHMNSASRYGLLAFSYEEDRSFVGNEVISKFQSGQYVI